MKRKFEETCTTSYSEARSLVFNMSIGKLQMSSSKPVEPSLWRSLLIVKTLHRIAEELHREATYANEASVEDKGAVENVFDDNQFETLFCLQNAPVAVFLSEDEGAATDDPNEQVSDSGKDSGMPVDETNGEPASLIMLSTYLPSSGVGLLSHHQAALDSTSRGGKVENGLTKTLTGLSGEHDSFSDIDCSCLESFSSSDFSDISLLSIDREFLLGAQSMTSSPFSALDDYHGSSGGIADLDSLMQALEN